MIGHRGAPGYRPEHTRSSYELALRSGVDAVEPDVVPTRDGVLVIRHENEISTTTDVADHPRFADRRTTKTIDGVARTGWFTEDFTWDELSSLRSRERLPRLRPDSAAFDDSEPMLRLRDLLDLVAGWPERSGRRPGVVLEIKHAAYFEAHGYDLAALVADELRGAGWGAEEHPLWFESFEPTVLARLRALGVPGEYVFLLEADGAPADLVAVDGASARTYAAWAAPDGLDELARTVDGVSLDKQMILAPDSRGRTAGSAPVVADAHARGLAVFTWTCRPENAFLIRQFRTPGGKASFGDYRAEWDVIAASGVDGVFVDHADLGMDFFGRSAQR